MKKLFGLLLLAIGIVFQGLKGSQIEDEQSKKESFNKHDNEETLATEEEQKEIQKKLKGLGYFQ